MALKRNFARRLTVTWVAALALAALVPAPGAAQTAPAWWTGRGVLTAGTANDFAALNAGQLKHLAHMAWLELETLPGGAGFVPAFTNAGSNYAAVNVGQLKETARPFYDRLAELGLAAGYPWSGNASDFAPANIGQAKFLFSFDLARDSDGDGMADGWEAAHGFDPLTGQADGIHGPGDDPDGDGVPNIEESLWKTDPWNADTDGDLLSDSGEILRHMTDPLLSDTDDNGIEDGYQLTCAFSLNANNPVPLGLDLVYDAARGYLPRLHGVVPGSTYEFYFTRTLQSPIVWIAGDLDMPGTDGGILTWWATYDGPGRKTGTSRYWFAGLSDDWDDDGLGSGYEMGILGLSPDLKDTDGNGIDDGDEDPDGDGLTNLQEYLGGSQGRPNPCSADTDGDGVCDGPLDPDGGGPIEAGPDAFPLDPSAWLDTDGDGMPDELVPGVPSNSQPPLVADDDDDNDGLTDEEELILGTDSKLVDTDDDGMPDAWEVAHGFDPLTDQADGIHGPGDDPDGDGLDNLHENLHGTDPFNNDTDGDSLSDFDEIEIGTNPTLADTDGDGITDSDESGYCKQIPFQWYDTSGGTNLLTGFTGVVDGRFWTLPLPLPVAVDGVLHTNITVDLNGLVYLPHPTNAAAVTSSYSDGNDLATWSYNRGHILVAAYWRSLLARLNRAPPTEIRVAALPDAGCTVVEFRNMGIVGYSTQTNETATFQVVLPHSGSNTVHVNYADASDLMRGTYATLGVQNPYRRLWSNTNRFYNLTWFRSTSYSAPASAVTPPMSLAYRIGSGTCPTNRDTDADGLLDGEEIYTWQTDPFNNDTDMDGLYDGYEIDIGTDPLSPDTDGDGMTDIWEIENGFDPLDPADAYDDPDGDGLYNISEFRAGTDPNDWDHDDDTVPDGIEAAWWEAAAPIPWFDVSGGTAILQNANLDDELIGVSLPFPVRVGGAVCTNAVLDINGIVYLVDRLKTEDGIVSDYNNRDLAGDWVLTDNHFAVAAHWDDLRSRTATPATRITVADVVTNGARFCVVEYRDMGFNSDSAARVSFQIVIPGGETNAVYVRYADVAGANTGVSATLGAQGLGAKINLPVSFDRPSITDGLTLAYHFGNGGSPFMKDSDGDGIDDPDEIVYGTSPSNPDSDGDGMPDKWEIDHGLDPLSGSGGDGADGDPDGDGLLNLDELEHGSYPYVSDTDNDGLNDLDEAGGVTFADIPWFDLSGGEDLTALLSNQDYSCLTVPLFGPVAVRGVTFTSLTLDIDGLVYLNPAGYQNTADSRGVGFDIAGGRTVNASTFTIAPFWDSLVAVTNAAPASQILSGCASDGATSYHVIEYRNMRRWGEWNMANSLVTFQLAVPTGTTDRVFVRYALAFGTADGRDASVGFQWLGGKQKDSWCYHQAGRVWPGLALAFVVGTGSSPLKGDTDCDGLTDSEEAFLGTDPSQPDTDNDGLTDEWEIANGFDPFVDNDTDGVPGNGAEDDPDGDGIKNKHENDLGTSVSTEDANGDGIPDGRDTDGDGVDDDAEVAQGSDPLDASDSEARDVVSVPFAFGDPSGSDSEKYRLTVTPVSGDPRPAMVRLNHNYGMTETVYLSLVRGARYTVEIEHAATEPDFMAEYGLSNCDWELAIGTAQGVVVDDPDHIVTKDIGWPNATFKAAGKHATLYLPKVESVEWETHEENTPLDTCPQNGGKRIFPDRQTPDDNNAAVRRKVTVKARITPALENQTVYFRAFDADDPSSDKSPVDGNDASGPAGGDNKGAGHALSAASAQTDASGCASVEFTVSMQPGDNFKMFASLDGPALNSLTQDGADADDAPAGIAQSEMLTVWRRLWLEFDSMGPVAVSGNEKNFEEGVVASVQQNVLSAGKSTLSVGMRLQDEEDRYEGGCIVIGGVTYTVLNNTDNLVFSDTVVVAGLVPSSAAGKAFAIYDDDYAPETLTLRRALPYALSGGTLIESAFGEAYIRPVSVPPEHIDTDAPFKRNLAYDEATFGVLWRTAVSVKKDLTDAADFWCIHLLAAWQEGWQVDGAPDRVTAGGADSELVLGRSLDNGNTGAIYVETVREREAIPVYPRIQEEHVVVHEIGHQGGAEHSDGLIMEEGATVNYSEFSPITINRFRSGETF